MLFVFRDIYLLMSWIITQHTTTTTTTTSTTMTTTTTTTLWVKKEQRYYSFIIAANDGWFSKFFHLWIQQEICYKSLAATATHWQWMLCAVSRQSTWVQQPSSNSLSGWYITVTHTCHCIHHALSGPYHRRSLQVRTTQLSIQLSFCGIFLE